MRYSFFKTIVFLLLLVILAQVADRYFFDQKINNLGTAMVKKPASYVFTKLENARFFLNRFTKVKNLAKENESLKNENSSLLFRLAGHEDLKAENDFLRKALGISPQSDRNVIYASIFYLQLGPDGYDAVLTKGSEDGISDNDAVITENGFLVGRIEKTYESFANVLIVNDSDFAVTAKVLNSDTVGIARGALNKGLYLDLIVQDDPIEEGDVIVSSGTDFFPPALVVGTVSYVEIGETDLFKTVKIKPSIEGARIGRVLVIGN